jgi:hypothetical protein
VFEDAEGAADSLRARGARELCAFKYMDGVAVAGALRRDALDALGRSKSPFAIRGSPLAPGARVRAEGGRPSVDPDALAASADADDLADDGPERGARMLMLQAAGAGKRGRVLNADGAAEIARPAAEVMRPPRATIVAPRARARALSFARTNAGARRTGMEHAGGTRVAAARASRRPG